jgi:hypothetical protein
VGGLGAPHISQAKGLSWAGSLSRSLDLAMWSMRPICKKEPLNHIRVLKQIRPVREEDHPEERVASHPEPDSSHCLRRLDLGRFPIACAVFAAGRPVVRRTISSVSTGRVAFRVERVRCGDVAWQMQPAQSRCRTWARWFASRIFSLPGDNPEGSFRSINSSTF